MKYSWAINTMKQSMEAKLVSRVCVAPFDSKIIVLMVKVKLLA